MTDTHVLRRIGDRWLVKAGSEAECQIAHFGNHAPETLEVVTLVEHLREPERPIATPDANRLLKAAERRQIAVAALPAVVKQYAEQNRGIGADHLPRNCAAIAVKIADALIEELAK